MFEILLLLNLCIFVINILLSICVNNMMFSGYEVINNIDLLSDVHLIMKVNVSCQIIISNCMFIAKIWTKNVRAKLRTYISKIILFVCVLSMIQLIIFMIAFEVGTNAMDTIKGEDLYVAFNRAVHFSLMIPVINRVYLAITVSDNPIEGKLPKIIFFCINLIMLIASIKFIKQITQNLDQIRLIFESVIQYFL